MGTSTHRFRVYEARRTTHPVWPEIEKFWFTVAAAEFPKNISTKANARDPVGLNRRVYRDVRESLIGNAAAPGTFDLMNKGITLLATKVKLVDKERGLYDVSVDDEEGGIVDGAHTAKLIEEAQEDGGIPAEQHVEVYIRTGIKGSLRTDIAKGLNTGMQVNTTSIFNIDHVFDWLKAEIANKPYAGSFAWKESDNKEYDVRDLVGVLEVLNVFDFPNEGDKHPIAAYEKWSVPLEKFGADFKEFRSKKGVGSKYYRLRTILKDGLALYDHVRHDFRDVHNASGGSAGLLKIVEQASKKRVTFDFPFANLEPKEYRLTKGATYPILGAFRNLVELDPRTGDARWKGGFSEVMKTWKQLGPNLVAEVYSATREIGRLPDQIGKSRKVWGGLHRELGFRLLQKQLNQKSRVSA